MTFITSISTITSSISGTNLGTGEGIYCSIDDNNISYYRSLKITGSLGLSLISGSNDITISGSIPSKTIYQSGGSQALNVANLHGQLADAQCVNVLINNTSICAAPSINFNNSSNISVSGSLSGSQVNLSLSASIPSNTTYQAGGSQELNVNGLSGTLTQPQKVNVLISGSLIGTAPTINISGFGISVSGSYDGTNNQINLLLLVSQLLQGTDIIISGNTISLNSMVSQNIIFSASGTAVNVLNNMMVGGFLSVPNIVSPSGALNIGTAGQNTINFGKTIHKQNIIYSGSISPSVITGTINNWSPISGSVVSRINISLSGSDTTLGGLNVGQVDGEVKYLLNTDNTFNVIIPPEYTGSTDIYRFAINATSSIPPQRCQKILYTSNRWHLC